VYKSRFEDWLRRLDVDNNLEACGHDLEVDTLANALKKIEEDVTGPRLRRRDMVTDLCTSER
jgi:hypothetical protein